MPGLFIFNPENDMALAFGGANYTPSSHAATFARECAFIMAWLANDNDYVVFDFAENSCQSTTECILRQNFGINSQRFTIGRATEISSVVPWGWSAELKSRLTRLGVNPAIMPSDDRIGVLRQLSHRRTSLVINKMLKEKGIAVPPRAEEIDNEDRLAEILRAGRRLMFKSPWSSSGRGVVDSSSTSVVELQRRLAGVIRRNGSIIAETWLDGIMDFAMLFEMVGGRASFVGLSLFDNHPGGAYAGNLVAPQEVIRDKIESIVGVDTLNSLQTALCDILSELIGEAYQGYCGVDMMAYRADDESLTVAPCIELNLRMTMGVVALKLARFIAPGTIAMMNVTKPADSFSFTCENGCLTGGAVNLTPGGKSFAIVLEIVNK